MNNNEPRPGLIRSVGRRGDCDRRAGPPRTRASAD